MKYKLCKFTIARLNKCQVIDVDGDFDWSGDWDDRAFGKLRKGQFVIAYRIDGQINGIPYNEELSGPDGMHFTLFQPPEISDEAIKLAKADIRHRRDATGFTVNKCLTF